MFSNEVRIGPDAARRIARRSGGRLFVVFETRNGELANGRTRDVWDVTCLLIHSYSWETALEYDRLDKPSPRELEAHSIRLSVHVPQTKKRVRDWIESVYRPARIPRKVEARWLLRLALSSKHFHTLLEGYLGTYTATELETARKLVWNDNHLEVQ
jgi:hypothetical protein